MLRLATCPEESPFGHRARGSAALAVTRLTLRPPITGAGRKLGSDEHGRAEWALALWSIASGEVASELLTVLERVLTGLPQSRRRTVLRAAEQLARSGWLKVRPVTGSSAEPELTALIGIRNSSPSGTQREARTHAPHDRTASQRSLLSVARSGQWLKVDAQPVYR